MGISTRTQKMLWGRSGNICAFPDCKKDLVMSIEETDDISIVGEEAHIIARSEEGPRGNSTLTIEERDQYSNLILLCSIHHKIIDDQPGKFTVDLIKNFKSTHESWIKKSLMIDESKQRDEELYSSYLDTITNLADADHWKHWTSFLFGGSHAKMHKKQYDNLRELVQFILSRVWPKRYLLLESSIQNLKSITNDFLRVFDEFLTEHGDFVATRKFYQIDEWDEEKYEKLHDRYIYHIRLILDLTCELTRAMNYLFDNVRQFLIPNYRTDEGVLLVEDGPTLQGAWITMRLEYKKEERTEYPYLGLRDFMVSRVNRNVSYGKGYSDRYFPPADL